MTLGYTLAGQGAIKVIACHTWLADHRTYGPMMPFIERDAFTFAFPDFRGYGKSKGMGGAFSVQEMGDDTVAVANALGWSEFHLMGHSMSGQSVHWIAGQKRHQGRVQSLTMMCPVPVQGFPLDENSQKFFRAAAEGLDSKAACATAVTAQRLGSGFASYMAELSAESATKDAILGYLETWSSSDVSGEVSPYHGRVSIFVGKHDPVLTEEVAKNRVAPAFPRPSLSVIEGAAHYPPLETPALTASLLSKTIRGDA